MTGWWCLSSWLKWLLQVLCRFSLEIKTFVVDVVIVVVVIFVDNDGLRYFVLLLCIWLKCMPKISFKLTIIYVATWPNVNFPLSSLVRCCYCYIYMIFLLTCLPPFCQFVTILFALHILSASTLVPQEDSVYLASLLGLLKFSFLLNSYLKVEIISPLFDLIVFMTLCCVSSSATSGCC